MPRRIPGLPEAESKSIVLRHHRDARGILVWIAVPVLVAGGFILSHILSQQAALEADCSSGGARAMQESYTTYEACMESWGFELLDEGLPLLLVLGLLTILFVGFIWLRQRTPRFVRTLIERPQSIIWFHGTVHTHKGSDVVLNTSVEIGLSNRSKQSLWIPNAKRDVVLDAIRRIAPRAHEGYSEGADSAFSDDPVFEVVDSPKLPASVWSPPAKVPEPSAELGLRPTAGQDDAGRGDAGTLLSDERGHDPAWAELFTRREEILGIAREWWMVLGTPQGPLDILDAIFGLDDAVATLVLFGEPGEALAGLAPLRPLWASAMESLERQRHNSPDLVAAAASLGIISAALGAPLDPTPPLAWVEALPDGSSLGSSVRGELLLAALDPIFSGMFSLRLSGWPRLLKEGTEDFADLLLCASAKGTGFGTLRAKIEALAVGS